MESKARGVLGVIGRRRFSFRRLCVWVFCFLVVATAIAVRRPVMTGSVRAVMAVTVIFGLFTALLHIVRLIAARPRTIYPAIFLCALFLTWVVLGNKPPDMLSLRATYVQRLKAFTGIQFRRGGETTRGMDSSGLARSAFWQATMIEGAKALNPRLLGPTLWTFWRRDLSAKDILDGRYGYTHVLDHAPKLAGYDAFWLQGGDMAVTQDGRHVLIYDGDGKWIEASPQDRKVVAHRATRNSKRTYFNVPVTFVRWWLLQE